MEVLKRAEEWRVKGNEFYKEKRYKKAAGMYLRGIGFVKSLVDKGHEYLAFAGEQQKKKVIDDKQAKEATILHVKLVSNLCQCYLNTERPEKAVVKSDEALVLLDKKSDFLSKEEKNMWRSKLLIRKINAYRQLKNFEKCSEVLKTAIKEFAQNKEVRSLYSSFREEYKVYLEVQKQKQKELFSNKVFN